MQKAIDILNLFDSDITELGNNEIASRLKLPPSTVSGLVYTLKKNNYLNQNPENHKYMLGLTLLDRASVLLNQIDIRQFAYPHLKELSIWSGESVNLAVLDKREIVYIERILSSHPLGINYEIGKKQPIHSTALGKAIVAFLPQLEINSLLLDYEFTAVTKYTITDKVEFINELELVLERGYSIDDQENEIGGRCVSAPILNKSAYPIAAISLSVPIQRLSNEQIKIVGARLVEACREITGTIPF